MISQLTALPVLMGAPAGGAAPAGSMFTTFITFGLIIAIFYFLIIRPQKRKEKQTKEMLSALKKGDKVVSIGGIRGTVLSVREATIVVKVDDNTRLEFSKGAIANVLNSQPAKEPEENVVELADREEKAPQQTASASKSKKASGKKGSTKAKGKTQKPQVEPESPVEVQENTDSTPEDESKKQQ